MQEKRLTAYYLKQKKTTPDTKVKSVNNVEVLCTKLNIKNKSINELTKELDNQIGFIEELELQIDNEEEKLSLI